MQVSLTQFRINRYFVVDALEPFRWAKTADEEKVWPFS